jgi:hypothetical protein
VKANLCQAVEEYPYSTFSGLAGRTKLALPLHLPRCGHGSSISTWDFARVSNWLNTPFRKEHDEALARALRRREFKLPKSPARRRSELEAGLC